MPVSSKTTVATLINKLLILAIYLSTSVSAWSPNRQLSLVLFSRPSHETILRFSASSGDLDVVSQDTSSSESEKTNAQETRRRFLNAAAMNICLLGGGAPAVLAADSPLPPGTKYISGKTPLAPGETKKSDSTKGTRKDPDFLRSVSDCKNQCQSSVGSDGLARSKEDCLSECQDICCKTYEQCTFNIVPRL